MAAVSDSLVADNNRLSVDFLEERPEIFGRFSSRTLDGAVLVQTAQRAGLYVALHHVLFLGSQSAALQETEGRDVLGVDHFPRIGSRG